MARLTARDFDQELLDLYDFYAHGRISKREFLDRAGRWAVGGITAAALLDMLSPDYALAEQVSFNDPDIAPEYIRYASPNGHGEVRGYLVRPANAAGPLPAVLVVHENRGLNPVYRGCSAARGEGGIPGACAGRADIGRRIPGQR